MSSPVLARLRQLPPTTVDGVVGAVVFATMVSSAAVVALDAAEPRLGAAGLVLLGLGSLPLAWRRRAPLPVLAVVGVATAAYGLADLPDPLLHLGLLVALYSVAAHSSRRMTAAVAAVGVVFTVVAVVGAGDSGVEDWFNSLLSVLVALLLGDGQRSRTAYLAEVEQRASRLQREQRSEAARAVAEERARVARELHDVVAHHVSMMVVQAEAGAATAADPSVVPAFDAIGATGREALIELRRTLGVLREDSAGPIIEPLPGVDRLDALVDEVRRAGLPVELRIEGSRRALADGVDLSVYRIVQEALTNVVKHAGPVPTTVVLRYGPDVLEVEVTDHGRRRSSDAPGSAAPGSGQGLIGIRERVALFGGELRVGPRRGGGFEVAARLPLGA